MIKQTSDTSDRPMTTQTSRRVRNRVPWTLRQTLYGVFLTLVPWIALNLLLTSQGGRTTLSRPLSFSSDLIGGVVQFIFTGVVEGAFLIAPFYYASKALAGESGAERKPRVRVVLQALGLRRFNLAHTLPWIIGLMLVIIGVNAFYSFAITTWHLNIQTNDQTVLQGGQYAPLTTYAVLAASVLIAPLCEEIFFRGFVFVGLVGKFSPIWAGLISAVLFAAAHADLGSFIPLLAIGLTLAFVRWQTGSTWASISLHMLNNLLSSVLIILAMHNANLPF